MKLIKKIGLIFGLLILNVMAGQMVKAQPAEYHELFQKARAEKAIQQKEGGMVLCPVLMKNKQKESVRSVMEQAVKIMKLIQLISFVVGGVLAVYYITEAVVTGIYSFGKYRTLGIALISILFINILFQMFVQTKVQKNKYYMSSRRPGIYLTECEEGQKGGIFVASRYIIEM